MIETLGAGWVRFVFEYAVASCVYLVGDFNSWDEGAEPLQHAANDTHVALIRLAPGEYEFKYKSGCLWFNDLWAHKYVSNCWGSETSVVVVPQFDVRGADLRTVPEGRAGKAVWC
jgi:hypothetical protein